MHAEPPKRNWFKTCVHAFCGAVLGAFLGLRAWGRSHDALSTSWLTGVAYIGGGALLVGLIAGLAAESGWDER
jgi:ABC-type Mn2+/Zn2+ transport system permease subunit